MKAYKKILFDVLDEVTCDVCKKSYNVEKDWEEAQEFIHIDEVVGYASVFGDGVNIQLDLCQHCANELLGKHFRTVER